jgi:putative transposase
MTIRNDLIDELLAGHDPASVMRQDGLLGELKKALLNRLMAAEFEHHLAHDRSSGEGKNHRNGSTRKRVLTDDSHVEVTIPRDREARFDPVLIGKYQRRLPGFDDKVISLYTRGMSTREIQGHLEEIYGAEVSPQLISTVTDAVTAEVAEWQSRPLEPLYPVMFFDAIRVKVRDQGTVCNKAVYLALGITPDGRKHILGLWIDPNEGAKFWLRIVNELRNRGVKDILIAVVDGLKGDAAQGSVGRSPMEWQRRFPRGDQRRLPANPGANVHRASAAQCLGLCLLAGPQARRGGAEADLPGAHG